MDPKSFFESRFRRYGNRPEALDWSARGQRVRFEILAGIGPLKGKSILDLGSGLGHLYGFLRERLKTFRYLGYDLSPRLVKAARKSYPEGTFEVRDVVREEIDGRYDFVLSSGLLNLETGANEKEIRSVVEKAWKVSTIGVGFNTLSTWANKAEEGRHFYNPSRLLSHARTLTPWVVLRHDYLPHDVTLYLFHEARA